MPTIEEMTAWTIDDIQSEIAQILPSGWAFDFDFDPDSGGWWAKFVVGSGDQEQTAREWFNCPEQRLLLLNAYGWLVSRDAKPRHPMWARRTTQIPKPIIGQRHLPGISVPDPEDIDPSEVQLVYRDPHTSPRRK